MKARADELSPRGRHRGVCVSVFFTLNRDLLTRRHTAQPVRMPMLQSERDKTSSVVTKTTTQTELQHCYVIISRADNAMPCHRT